MNVLVALEHRFSRLPDGSVWTDTSCSRSFWERYLAVFSSVSAIARVANVDSVSSTAKRVDGPGVSILPISNYVGPWEYVRKLRQVRRDLAQASQHEGAVILRVSSQISTGVEHHLRSTGRPYGVEVVGDPYDVFSPGSVRHPLRPFFRWWVPRELRRQCAAACATAYVTAQALQKRYPGAPGAFTTHYSSVELRSDAFAPTGRPAPPQDRPIGIIMVGTLSELYKAPDVLIRAFAACRRKGLNAELKLLGGGRQTPLLQKLASELNVAGHVNFLGSVPGGDAVREHLDAADLFVLPSRQEGLPRAMIEAMARGLPCIGSTVGGIPELLEPAYLVPPNDAESLAEKMMRLGSHPSEMATASARNLEKAREYGEEILSKRRLAFYQHILQTTSEWMSAGKRRSFRVQPMRRKLQRKLYKSVSMKSALVTGGAGFIGSHLVDWLLENGWSVTVIENFDPFYPIEIKQRNILRHRDYRDYRLVEIDICDEEALSKAGGHDFDVIVHLAAKAGVRPSILDPLAYQRVNVIGTQNVLELARIRGVRQFILASSSSVYGVNPNVPWKESDHVLLPISPYASTKVSTELLSHVYAHLYGIRILALRFFTVFGPRQRPDLSDP